MLKYGVMGAMIYLFIYPALALALAIISISTTVKAIKALSAIRKVKLSRNNKEVTYRKETARAILDIVISIFLFAIGIYLFTLVIPR